MNSVIDELKKRYQELLEEYHEAQNEWQNDHAEEIELLKEEFDHILSNKDNQLTSLEGELEDLRRELKSSEEEKAKLIFRWKAEIQKIIQKDNEISVKACMDNMLDILELRDQNTTQEKLIKSLQKENEDLKRSKSQSVKRFVASKNIRATPKLNMSDISLSSGLSKNKIGIKKKFKINGGKLKISKSKIINNERRPEIDQLKT